jgi:NAD-dependent dihydropyrimidine dehydrogenase PreA subunit
VTLDLPALDDTRCSGSAVCVAVCPTGCLEMSASRPWMPRPADCVNCGACVSVCPTHALAMAPAPE